MPPSHSREADVPRAFMRGKEKDQAVGQAAFATHPGNYWRGHRFASLYGIDKQFLGSRCFVHKAEAAAGLAGRVCGFSGLGWMLTHPPGSPLFTW